MTLEQERSYKARIAAAIEAERDWNCRNDAGEFDDMDDAEWRPMMESVREIYKAFFCGKFSRPLPGRFLSKNRGRT